jgi:putative oxidoreductase
MRVGLSEASKKEFLMTNKRLRTDSDIATATVRLNLGVVFFAHGAQKLLGWFGG